MENTDHTTAAYIAPGTVPMARINGAEIRRLRESKGLTQLYMATVIGVTTDTISRWENRRYPSIKLENAERLAQALEVDIDAILEHAADDAPPATPAQAPEVEGQSSIEPTPPSAPADTAGSATSVVPRRRSHLAWLLPIILLVSVGGLGLWLTKPVAPEITVDAKRILPDHIPAGQTFPVLIRVTTSQPAPVSLILKETIPPGCRVIHAEPSLASEAGKGSSLKWVSRTDGQETTFAYLIQAPAKANDDDQLRFSGGVTLNQGDQTQTEISGAATMTIAPYHWADLDRSNKIDDEEVLAVYDRYSALEQLDFDRDFIDGLWASNGYSWDRKTGKYVVQK